MSGLNFGQFKQSVNYEKRLVSKIFSKNIIQQKISLLWIKRERERLIFRKGVVWNNKINEKEIGCGTMYQG